MSRCPHCGGDPSPSQAAVNNCQRFHSTPVVRARCCGRGVQLHPVFSFVMEKAPAGTTTDLFGVALEPQE